MSLLAKIRQAFGFLLAGVLLFFLIKPFVQTHSQLKDVSFHIQWHWLIPSFGFILLYRIVYIYPFAALLSCIRKKHFPFRDAFLIFHLTNITRYLPGRIWGIVRLLSLSRQFGLNKTAVGSSLTLHVGIETAIGGIIAMSLLFSTTMRQTATGILEKKSGHVLLVVLGICGILLMVLFGIPKLASYTRQFLKNLRPLLENSRLWFSVLASHSLLWLCQGIAFFLFIRSLVSPVRWADAGVLMACYALAWIVGFLSFLTPGGLGVREGLLGLLLANDMPASQATLIALLCRVWMLSAEIVLAGTAFFFKVRESKGKTVK